MKIFITCAVIALVAAIVFSAAQPGDISGPAEVAGPEQQEPVAQTALPGERMAVRKPAAAPAANNAVAIVQETTITALFDVLPVYDALLVLNFAEGELLVDRNTLAALQAIYAALGQDAGADAFAELQSVLEEALPAAAAVQLLEMTRQYFSYRQAEQDVRAAAAQQSNDPMQSYRQLVALRRTYLGEDTAGQLFAEEETQVPYMISAFAVARDKSLSAEARAVRLAELQEAFNNSASRMDSPLARKVLEAKVARLRAGGAGENEVFAVREEVLGSAEAQRLAERDQMEGGRPKETGAHE
ncbi:lipase chaperone [Microbulbifer harenosus]|uniref:Lipase chaperone n=1 Tax=Microbulbifer harenosus TaxID=2576840 RepID=A0ABY2UCZ3_9GAMM|nr:lipase chaperone [Microbulbifer harenosus]